MEPPKALSRASTAKSSRGPETYGARASPCTAIDGLAPALGAICAEIAHQLAHRATAERRYRTTRHSRVPPSWLLL
jgi:hypothetical protein